MYNDIVHFYYDSMNEAVDNIDTFYNQTELLVKHDEAKNQSNFSGNHEVVRFVDND